jgi:uncharacterized membrane protein YheB (UPF0754 family)
MNNWLLLIPVISSFIGWITNWVAIKMLFHPKEPKKILGITFQGIFPKRQHQFAIKLGKLVSEELISFDEISEKISSGNNLQKVMPLIEEHLDHFLKVKLAASMPMISMFIGDKTINQLKAVFITELEELFPKIMQQYSHQIKDEIDIEKIVTDKVQAFSSDKLEDILYSIMAKEFRFIEILGAILGFIIGVIQVVITVFTYK